jgi:hypothetical protein
MTRSPRLLALPVALVLGLAACTTTPSGSPATPETSSSAAEAASDAAASDGAASSVPAVTGNECPQVFDASQADFYPIQPSFSAGYTAAGQHLNSDTADWAYVVEGDFPYSNWMAWYLYSAKGVPLFKFSDTAITPDQGSTNPFVDGNPILAPERSYHIYFMPSSTPASVVTSMQDEGKNVALLPTSESTPDVVIVSRSYWPFSNDGLGDYDRFGYGGPTDTPSPTITAYLTDATTGELTDTPVEDCSAQSVLPEKVWYDADTKSPVITFVDAPVPTQQEISDLPHWLLQTGSVSGSMGAEFPPSPVVEEVQFYRNVAAHAPFADVQSAPAPGDPPDACGGYVMANLPNDVVSLVHIPKVPSFPDYSGATASTLNTSNSDDVQFYSIVIYGGTKQLDAFGTLRNSQIGNRQIKQDADGSATVVLYPNMATSEEIDRIDAVVTANGWNLLKSGVQTAVAPNLLVIREKGQNKNWKHALSANDVTQGAPCPQSTDPSLPLPQDPPSAQVTQFNGMGLTAPQGQNCTIEEFLSGACLEAFKDQLREDGSQWSASSAEGPTQKGA